MCLELGPARKSPNPSISDPAQSELGIVQLGLLAFFLLKTHSHGTANGAEKILKTQQSRGTSNWEWKTRHST